MRSCKSSMYLSSRRMVSEGSADETVGVIIYAFVPHFCGNESAQGYDQTPGYSKNPRRPTRAFAGVPYLQGCLYLLQLLQTPSPFW